MLLPLSWGPLQAWLGVPRVVFGALLALTVASGAWFAAGRVVVRAAAGRSVAAAAAA